ncbi:MAG TPA: pyruvate dehydrogenase (acetyl-transferring) E1 component subunit alpha [Acidobacteriota bacterium]|nr:pyruvate dehydrogenase (acetyl-transferring) E1 component subunit alpha [Acidobacteriota bacterium]
MSEEIYRILKTNGRLEKGRKTPSIDDDRLRDMYRYMLINRLVDERMTKLQRQGRIGFYIGSVGEEAAVIGSALAMRDDDWIVPCYRELGAALVRGFSLYKFCCQLFGNAEDPIKGRQMPNHYSARDLKFTSISSPVGTQIPHAAGLGMGLNIQDKKNAVLVFFGDGATSQGDFHVGANFAGVFKAPVVFLCRNNQWAISVPGERQTASESFAIKAEAYGFEGIRVDGNDVLAVYETVRKAAEKAYAGDGPTLVEAVTYRQGAHSTSDDPRAYRDEEEVERWKERDPLNRMKSYLKHRDLWSDEEDDKLRDETVKEIAQAVKKAEKVGPPDIEEIFNDVYAQRPWHLQEQYEQLRGLAE